MSYLSTVNKYIDIYLYDNNQYIKELIMDEFINFLNNSKCNNLDIISFEKLFKSNEFKNKLNTNEKYSIYILKKEITSLTEKMNLLLIIIGLIFIREYLNEF